MKKIFFQIFIVLMCLTAQAQKVSNIRAEQRGQSIVVFYSLETTSPCEVSLLLSQDGGVTWSGPLKNVSGDVGDNVNVGDKQIIWKVLEEQESLVGEKIKFKVVANGRKFIEMVLVGGGTFQMGSDYGDSDENPVHSVTLSSFNIGKYEVTQTQWKAVMGSNPSFFSGCDNCPVEQVSWNDVQQYIQKLNAQTGKNYRLPTEAEWEYAAKGGKGGRGYTYSGSNDISSVGWYTDNSGSTTYTVGTKQANELGIYDMSGNVWEWCSDWYGNYNSNSVTNPTTGVIDGIGRVLRGGSVDSDVYYCRATARNWYYKHANDYISGFRLVLSADTGLLNFLNYQKFGNGNKSYEPEMVFVEGGTFQMGSNSSVRGLQPVHSVALDPYYIGKCEVTQYQWETIMGSNPSYFSGCDNCPVESVSWNDVQEFIKKLNERDGSNYRLPTEAEWEYAAKGGQSSKGYVYSGSNDPGAVGWNNDNSGGKTHAVGTKHPNELGIYDMTGNVVEWCSDWFGYYSSNCVTNPTGPTFGSWRLLRGGGWDSGEVPTVGRGGGLVDLKYNDYGFRLVLPLE